MDKWNEAVKKCAIMSKFSELHGSYEAPDYKLLDKIKTNLNPIYLEAVERAEKAEKMLDMLIETHAPSCSDCICGTDCNDFPGGGDYDTCRDRIKAELTRRTEEERGIK